MNGNRAHVYISGLVQGVCFRAYTKEKAVKFGLTGYVKNLPDGRVEAVFEGQEDNIKKMIEWCHKGPPTANVEKVDVYLEKPRGSFTEFKIL